jgi:hypothetical protein
MTAVDRSFACRHPRSVPPASHRPLTRASPRAFGVPWFAGS